MGIPNFLSILFDHGYKKVFSYVPFCCRIKLYDKDIEKCESYEANAADKRSVH